MRVLWTTNEDPSQMNSMVFIEASMSGLGQHGVQVTLDCIGPLRSPRALRRAARVVGRRAKSFDLIHAQYGSACGFVTSRVRGVRKLVTIRGSDWSTALCGTLKWRTYKVLARTMTQLCLHRYEHVITVSHRLAVAVKAFRRNSSVSVVPSAIDLTRFRPMDRAKARHSLGYGDDTRPWVLFTSVSRSNPVKRLWLAEAAVELAAQQRPGVCLKVVSGVPHAMVPLHVAACDVILCTSTAEGWPNSVKEALACGIPFVSTDVSDLAVLAERLPGCRVCEPTAEALARGLVAALDANIGDSDRIAIRDSVSNFGTDHNAAHLAAIYRSVLEA
jgi:glycosyltransferase involved in cell wall biosynthesis